MKNLITILILFGLTFIVNAQIDLKDKLKGAVNPDELVSLSETISFEQAIQVLGKVSEKISGKRIISTVNLDTPIGVEINNWPYKKALLVIVQYHNLIVDETESTVIVKKKSEALGVADESFVSIDEREVRISAVMFEANVAEMREKGVNWEFLLSQKGISIGGNLISSQEQSSASTTGTTPASPSFTLGSTTSFDLGPWDGKATTLFKFFEDENLGKIISRPVISTVNGKQGKTQVGSDFSVKERDFAGNLIDKFYQSGTIIEVTPNVYTGDGIDYMVLKVRMERSSVVIGSISIEKPKTEVTTNVLLLNGEETAIGGLIVNQEAIVRKGIPFLKDLPWWFLGLRYIFGYDQETVSQKEIILLIKADILPSLKERMSKPKDSTFLKKAIENQQNEMEKLQEQSKKKKEEQK